MVIEGDFNYLLVVISVFIAIFISNSSLHILAKVSHTRSKEKYVWLISGSVLMGTAIWSTHLLGMLAFHLPIQISYNGWLILLSILVSFTFIFLSFYIIMPENINTYNIGLAGFLLGTGIVTMHHIGMIAMLVPAESYFNMNLTILSIIITYIAAYTVLPMYLRFRNQRSFTWLKVISATIIGISIVGMHYIGMRAVKFYAHDSLITNNSSLDTLLFFSISMTIFVIFLASRGAVYLESKVLEKVAYQDTLTGLSNRRGMNRFISPLISNKNVGVLFLDLDEFKVVNDQFGHDVGDRLIQEVAMRLQGFVSNQQQVFRIGGDEFILIVHPCNVEYMEELAEQVLQSIKRVYAIADKEIWITVSIGICVGTVEDASATTLRQKADIAMYRSKALGRNQYCVYDDKLDMEVFRSAELEKDIQMALDNEQFYIEYQPKWNVADECLHGFEALLRWEHPRFGRVAPNEFIPISERNRMIIPITLWVLESACLQSIKWQKQGLYQPISVNLSARLFEIDDLSVHVEHILEKTGLAPNLLEFEITESMILQDINRVIIQLERIRGLGIKISMDDFGTGYSSIGLLDHIPIDTLKLDRLFIKDIETKTKRSIIKAIILMAESLNLDVIAEGVESQEHVDTLTELGCYLIQGYFYSKPMKVAEINEVIQRETGCLSTLSPS